MNAATKAARYALGASDHEIERLDRQAASLDAGLAQPQGFGVQSYAPAGDPRGPTLLSGVVRTLAPRIVACGVASTERIGIDTLEQRVAAELRSAGSVAVLPTLAGAWARRE